jgi:acetaldehyde dehydrogenase
VPHDRIRVAILGSGNIGIDLCERLLLDSDFEVVAIAGRRSDSPGLVRFHGRVPIIATNGISDLVSNFDYFDGVFDATSSFDHPEHWRITKEHGKWIIDLTPSSIGRPTVPCLVDRVNSMHLNPGHEADNLSMISCGGQSSAPLLYAITQGVTGISSVEVSISVASVSAGPATRLNVDHYVEATEALASQVTGCADAKAILVLNPADPPVMMRTTAMVQASSIDLEAVQEACDRMVAEVQLTVPGYDIAVAPHCPMENLVSVTARVVGAGLYLPPYAGNLDIINSAAVESARIIGRHHLLLEAAQ